MQNKHKHYQNTLYFQKSTNHLLTKYTQKQTGKQTVHTVKQHHLKILHFPRGNFVRLRQSEWPALLMSGYEVIYITFSQDLISFLKVRNFQNMTTCDSGENRLLLKQSAYIVTLSSLQHLVQWHLLRPRLITSTETQHGHQSNQKHTDIMSEPQVHTNRCSVIQFTFIHLSHSRHPSSLNKWMNERKIYISRSKAYKCILNLPCLTEN